MSCQSLLLQHGMAIAKAKISLENRKVLLDFGTHQGEGLHKLITEHGVDETWEVYTFEANPYTYAHFATFREKIATLPEAVEKLPWLLWSNITYFNNAVWKEDADTVVSCIQDVHKSITLAHLYGEPTLKHLELSLVGCFLSGGSTIAKKGNEEELDADGLRMSPIVKAVDIAKWMQHNFTANDYIVMKVDIEGVEGKVLHHMIQKRVIDFVNWIAIEWHEEEYLAFTPNPHLQYWQKGFVNGYLERLEDEGKLHVSSWQ